MIGLGIKLGAARAGVNYAKLFLETYQISQREKLICLFGQITPIFFFLLKVILLNKID